MKEVLAKRNLFCDRKVNMAEEQQRVGERRPGGRATRVRSAVLEAASELLANAGYDKLSIEDVATRAGVHKTTVYRRWPSKAELVFDVVRQQADDNVPLPHTGTLLGDLEALAQSVVSNLNSADGAGRAHGRQIVAAAATSNDLAQNMHVFWAHRFALVEQVVERAIERGEVPENTDTELIIEALVGPIWLRVLLTGKPVTPQYAQRIAAFVNAGAVTT